MHARTRLLPILMTLGELELALDHPIEAEAARVAAYHVIAYIAEHSPEDLRASFLSLPAVRAVVCAAEFDRREQPAMGDQVAPGAVGAPSGGEDE